MKSIVPVPGPAYSVTMSPAGCALDLGCGSERGEYVSQDYLFRVLGKPHRSINLMYCYYPLDKGWPARASVRFKPTAGFAWAYPYDDYFPYQGGPGGTRSGEPFNQIREIRRHGQDATLTLTIDCLLKNKVLKSIARELAPFGNLRLRINHECDGTWFAFNKRHDHKTISDFFIRFNDVLKTEAPNIKTISCFGSVDLKTGRLKGEDGLTPMLKHADLWSVDKYINLHYAWPGTICEQDQLDHGYSFAGSDFVWRELKHVHEIFCERSGMEKPLEICEFNADGDVGGRALQAKLLAEFYRGVHSRKPRFLSGITYYQFRDRGRLGLEQEDPNNPAVGIPTPFLDSYRTLMRQPHFNTVDTWSRARPGAGLNMVWTNAENAQGQGWKVGVKPGAAFFELRFDKNANLVIKVGDEWFYKKPGVEWVDATTAVASLKRKSAVPISVFAPPANGEGIGARSNLSQVPQLRLQYDWGIEPERQDWVVSKPA